jgi:leukotriene-A4 hydrolase
MSTRPEWAPAPAPSLADDASTPSVFVDVDQRSVTPVDKRASASEDAQALFDTALKSGNALSSLTTDVTVRTCAAPLDAFIVRGCVAEDECEALMRAAERAGYSFWSAEEAEDARAATAGTSDDAGDGDRRGSNFRNADTVEVHSTTIADELWRRLRAHVEKEVIVDASHPLAEPGTEGKWVACGVNDHLLFNRYDASGHFSPHTDGATIRDFNCRSLYSVLVYLNDCERGGETSLFAPPPDAAPNKFILDASNRYRWPKEWIVDAAPVERGSVLVFRQDIPHEGAPRG